MTDAEELKQMKRLAEAIHRLDQIIQRLSDPRLSDAEIAADAVEAERIAADFNGPDSDLSWLVSQIVKAGGQ